MNTFTDVLFRCLFILFFSVGSSQLYAQSVFTRDQSIPVSKLGKNLSMAWAGGLNNPQISNIDLNADGIKDVFVFDRSNSKIYTCINQGNSSFTYHPEYADSFPVLHDWVLLVDYNGDGKEDVFTSAEWNADIGISVYRNDSKGNQMHFTQVHAPILNIPGENIYISQWDIPGIADIDHDGDIDILNFDFGGAAMYMYKNNSVETYGVPDSLVYVRYDACWGKFMEDFGDCSVTLNISCKGNSSHHPDSVQDMHAGSTILSFEGNGDRATELLIGDVICPYMYKLTNIGDSLNAIFTGYDKAFPPIDPINVTRFPAGFSADMDNDGIKDLLVAPNALNVSNNISSLHYYRNAGTNSLPAFYKMEEDFLQNEMVDVGEFSYPVFFDENGDGLLDLIISNFKYFVSPGIFSSRMALYRNTGTKDKPAYTFITDNWGNIEKVLNVGALFPAFGDLDGDGDSDMLVGDVNGNVHYFENTAGAGKTAVFVLKFFKYLNIDIGQNASPQIVDVNADGLPDLLMGEKDGNINYFQNIGTSFVPDFKLMNTKFGNINVKENDLNDGLSIPFLCNYNASCHSILFVGSGSGKVFAYTGIDKDLSASFSEDTIFSNHRAEGTASSVCLADINHDGFQDMIVGNRGGGISFYRNTQATWNCASDTVLKALPYRVMALPNPAKDQYTIQIEGTNLDDHIRIYFYDAIGKCISAKTLAAGFPKTTIETETNEWPAGVYLYQIKMELNAGKDIKNYAGKMMVIK